MCRERCRESFCNNRGLIPSFGGMKSENLFPLSKKIPNSYSARTTPALLLQQGTKPGSKGSHNLINFISNETKHFLVMPRILCKVDRIIKSDLDNILLDSVQNPNSHNL